MKAFQRLSSIIFLLITLLNAASAQAQSNWFWQQPLPTGNSLKDVKFVNHQTGYAVGDVGTIVKSTNGGFNWFMLNNPKKSQLWGIDFAPGNANVLVAVGDSGLILRTSNAGESWNVIQFQAGVIYEDVDFVNSATGYVAGSGGRIFKTTNAGANWFQQTSPTGASFLRVNFFDENFGAIGGTTRLLLTTNAGTTWIVQNLTFFPFEQVAGIAAVDSATVIGIVNNNGGTKFRTTNRGQNWTEESLGIPNQDLVRDLSFSGKNKGTIVCDLGMILTTTNAGVSWKIDSTFYQYFQRSYGIDLLRGVHMVDTSLTFISGGGGSIYRSTNSGENWTILNGGYFDLHGTYFINANTGWAVGEEGTLQKTINGGSNWSFYPQITRDVLRDVMFPSTTTGYISGDSGVILKTTNAGTNWIFLNSSTRINLFDIFFINNETGYCGGGFTSGDSIGTGTIIKTTNGGMNWSRSFYSQDSGWVNALHFFDANTGVACFDASITRTTNGGASWITVGYSSTGRGLDMSFPNNQTGYAAGGSNTFYKTTNSGVSWLGYSTGNPGVVIQTINFINSLKGFAAGPYGEILYTENGGINWSISKNVSDNYITCINFSDSLNGTMTGFFGTILRTTNGGISYIGGESQIIPDDFQLYQNYPNPFNPVTIIGFSLKRSANVMITLTNILGEQVRVLTDKRMAAGEHELLLYSMELPTGVYFYSLIANGIMVQTKKLHLIR